MQISELCIRRPVFSTVINIFLILLGVIAFDRLTVREYPLIDEPVVTVQTNYLGASAEIIESQVTKVMEDSLAGIEGIEIMSSVSRSEQSQITLRFKLTRDVDDAANDVRDRVSRARKSLPDEIDEPIIAKVEADAQPIIYLAFNSTKHSPMEISDYADRYVTDRLQNIPGVAQAQILGERRKSMRIWLDPQRLAAFQLTTQDIEDALRKQNVEIPAGRIESTKREFTVLSETDLKTTDQFENIIVKQSGDQLVRLKDIGRAEIAPEDERRVVRFNGQNAVALGIIKQSTANPLEVSKSIYALLPQIEKDLPEGMSLSVANDSSEFIDRSIKEVYKTIGEATVLVVLVIFFFLRNLRSTIVPLVTIPISLIGTFLIMMLLGYSINTLTLLALVLAIGLVVDDAIVVLENIFRYVEKGMKPFDAAIKGSKEIGFAVVAMTITLAAVYAPIAFTEGKTGKLFIEFAITLAGAVVISGFTALTLTPMMCSRLLKHEEQHSTLFNLIENFLHKMTTGYQFILTKLLSIRPVIILVGIGVAGASVFLFHILKSELTPVEDRNSIITIASGPEGATIDYMSEWMTKIEPILKNTPEVDKYFIVAGAPIVSQGIAFARLKPWEERSRKQQDITTELAPKIFAATPGIMAFPTNPPSLGDNARSKPLEMVIMTSGSYADLDKNVEKIMQEAASIPGLINLDTDLKLNKPQISVFIDRDKTASLGINIDTVGRTLETMLGGRQVTRFKDNGEQYDVMVQIEDKLRTSPQDLTDIFVRNSSGDMVKLSNILSFKENVAPRELNHFNQLRAAKITASIAPGYTLGEGIKSLEATARKILPKTDMIDYDSEAREFGKSSSSLAVAFVLALFFIYLVLAAQFESFTNPFIIMLSVPLSMTGALLALYLSHGTLNIYSQIGLVTLIGLITKHGILIVEFANQLREHEGLDRMQAVIKSASLRLRPILMTTGAMVLGAMPLALGEGAGSESRAQIGWVIIGGMMIGTLFTLFIVPTVYTYMARKELNHQDA